MKFFLLWLLIGLYALSIDVYSQCDQPFFVNTNNKFTDFVIPSGLSYSKPCLVDIDGDGDMDLFSGSNNGYIYYYKNTGSASNSIFTLQISNDNPFNGIDVGNNSAPAFVDIDNDGDYDAFIGEYFGTISYYKNIGTALTPVFTLQSPNDNPLYNLTLFIDIALIFIDIDKDGDQDAFIGNQDGTIYYYKNMGTSVSPIFTLQTSTLNPFNGIDVVGSSVPAFVDIDSDSDYDVFIGANYGKIYYCKNVGSSSNPVFVLQSSLANVLGWLDVSNNASPFFVDIDTDGDADIVIGSLDGQLNYFQNTGSPSKPIFTQQIILTNMDGIEIDSFPKPTFIDIDSDMDLDLFIGEFDGTIRFYKNTSTSNTPIYTLQLFSDNPLDGIDVGENATPAFIDIDNDGDQDAYIGGFDGVVYYFKNTGTVINPVFTQQLGANNPFNGFDVGYNSSPSFVDIDNDSDKDVFIGTYNGTSDYYENIGTISNPAFIEQISSSNPLDGINVGSNSKPSFIDIDIDGDFDCFVGASDGTIYYYTNTGNNSSAIFTNQIYSSPFNGMDVGANATPTFVDIDSDGDQDVFIGESSGHIYYYKNYGTASAPSFFLETSSANSLNQVNALGYSAPAFADIDNDGDLDAFVGQMDGYIYYYENIGTAYNSLFIHQTGIQNPLDNVKVGYYATPAFADIDSDGDLDVFVGSESGKIFYYKNEGTNYSPLFAMQLSSNNPFDAVDVGTKSIIAFCDIDNDGDMDAFIGEKDGYINYFQNTGTAYIPVFTQQLSSLNPLDSVYVASYSAPIFVDIDNDKDFDVFIGESLGRIYFYKNSGTVNSPVFNQQTSSSNPFDGTLVPYDPVTTFADIDKDGDMDAFIGNDDGKIKYYQNNQNINIRNLNGDTIKICTNDGILLKTYGAYNLTWNNGINNGTIVYADSSQIYTVIGDNGLGCKDTAFLNVFVYSLPNVIANASVVSICKGNSVILYGNGAQTYAWNNNVKDSIGFIPIATNNYIISGTDSNGCANSDTITITVNELPTINAIVTNVVNNNDGAIDITVSSGQPPYQYDWDNDSTGDNDDTEDLNNISVGAYTLKVTDDNGCFDTIVVAVKNQSSINEISNYQNISIYPNPAKNILNIQTSAKLDKLEIIDVYGKKVNEFNKSELLNKSIAIDHLSDGIYLVKIYSGNQILNKQLVKE